MVDYFRQLARLQDGIENTYKPNTEKKLCVLKTAEKAQKLAKRHLLFVNAKNIPAEISDWHEQRAKLNLEIGARLIYYYQKL